MDGDSSAATAVAPALPANTPVGHVDFHISRGEIGGTVVGGWLRRDWALASRHSITLNAGNHPAFARRTVFYDRTDLDETGVGFLLFFDGDPNRTALNSVQFGSAQAALTIEPALETAEKQGAQVLAWLQQVLSRAENVVAECEDDRRALLAIVSEAERSLKHKNREIGAGPVDYYGYHPGAGGWFLCGWLAPGDVGPIAQTASLIHNETTEVGEAIVVAFERPDLTGQAVGIIVYVEAPRVPLTEVTAVTVPTDTGLIWLRIGPKRRRSGKPS